MVSDIFFSVFSFSIVLHYVFHGNQYKGAVDQTYMANTRLFKEHFYKSFVKIPAIA